jgi:hypothetical protein
VWRKEDELKQLKSELATLNRKIDLSLKPIDTSEDKPTEKQAENQKATIIAIPGRLQEYKEAMGDRLVVASVPKFETEKQMKGIKI